jgi:hypothetical protein
MQHSTPDKDSVILQRVFWSHSGDNRNKEAILISSLSRTASNSLLSRGKKKDTKTTMFNSPVVF